MNSSLGLASIKSLILEGPEGRNATLFMKEEHHGRYARSVKEGVSWRESEGALAPSFSFSYLLLKAKG